MSDRYLRDLSRDVRRGKMFMATQHKAYQGGPVPVGYKTKPKSTYSILVPDDKTAPIVRAMFEMRAAGATYYEIQQAYPILSAVSSVVVVLANRTYTGTMEYAGHIIEDFCEPIISQELFDKVQQLGIERAKNMAPRSVRSIYILSGLVYCVQCGSKMLGASKGQEKDSSKRWYYYNCEGKKLENGKICSSRS